MRNFSLRQTISVILIPTLSLFFEIGYVHADIFGGSSSSTTSTISDLIGGYSSDYWTLPQGTPPNLPGVSNLYLFTQSPSFDDSIVNNLYFANYLANLSTTNLTPTSPTVTGINTLLTATSSNAATALSTAMTHFLPLPTTPTSTTATPPQATLYNINLQGQVNSMTVTPTPPGASSSSSSSSSSNTSSSSSSSSNSSTQVGDVNYLNMESVVDPIQYGTTNYNAATNAQNFIMYLSNQYNPMPLIDFTSIIASGATSSGTNPLQQALGNSSVQQYLYLVRQMVASYSVGMSDLYYLYNQRVPQPTSTLLGTQFQSITQSTLPANLQKQASPLAIEQWSATHRLTSYDPSTSTPPWLTAMENATPATLQRENLYLLAEIREEMFKDRMLQERILATLAAQQLQSAGSQQLQLQQLQSSICQNAPFSGTSACPAPPVPPASSGTSS